jgi:hypothetical protein
LEIHLLFALDLDCKRLRDIPNVSR